MAVVFVGALVITIPVLIFSVTVSSLFDIAIHDALAFALDHWIVCVILAIIAASIYNGEQRRRRQGSTGDV